MLGGKQYAAHEFNAIFDIHRFIARLPGRAAREA